MLPTCPRLLLAILLLVAIAAPAQATAVRQHRYLAVMPFDTRGAEIDDTARRVLEETVRTEAGNLLSGLGFVIFTNDNTLQLLADNGIDPDKACDASCSLEVAREITADYFVTGAVTSVEEELVLFIRLLNTKTAQQLSSLHLDSKTINGLRSQLVKESGTLFVTLRNQALVRKAHAGNATEGQITAKRGAFQFSVDEKEIVEFKSVPNKAIVRLNETIVCNETPCSRSVPLGQHLVTMESERHLPATEVINVVKDPEKPQLVSLTLPPTFGTLAITTKPEGVTVSIDGKEKTRAPFSLELDPGIYEVKIAEPCYQPDGERVVVKAGDKRTLKLKASKRQAGISVEAVDTSKNALKARIEVDGKSYGNTPRNLRIPLCARTLRVVTGDGDVWEKKLELKENKADWIVATFDVKPKVEETTGTLAITTEPVGLAVSIDDKEKRRAPLSLDLAPGAYEVKIADPCYLPDGERVVINAGDKSALKLKANKRQVGMTVEAVDASKNALTARIEVDGKGYGNTPKNLKVPLCSRTLRVVTGDGEVWERKLALKENKADWIVATLDVKPKVKSKQRIPTWAYWVGGVGAGTWLGAGVGAIAVREDIRGLPPGHAEIESGITTGKTLMVVSSVGAAAVLTAGIAGIVGLASK